MSRLSKAIIIIYICFLVAITLLFIPTNAYLYKSDDNEMLKYYKYTYKPIWNYKLIEHKDKDDLLWLYKRDYGQIYLYILLSTLIASSMLYLNKQKG